MEELIVSAKSSNEEEVMRIEKASIFQRAKRKYWYRRYQVIYENGNVERKEESTKVLLTEESFEYMTYSYLPVWLVKKEEEIAGLGKISKKFSYYTEIFLSNHTHMRSYGDLESKAKQILKTFGKRDILSITKLDIKQYINALSYRGKPIIKNTKKKWLRVFHGAFELALDDDAIPKDITTEIKFTGSERDLDEVKPFFEDEVRTLLEYSKNPKYGEHLHNYLGVAFNQGMSPSEIIGLKYGDINLDIPKPTISIIRSVTKSTTGATKNKYRKRTIPIMKGAIPYIRNLMDLARKKHSLWLFSNDDGLHLGDIQKIRGTRLILKNNRRLKHESGWYLLLSDTNIEYRHLKNCRHSFAVRVLDNPNVKKMVLANMLGHSSTRMIDEHYAKWTEGRALELDTDIDLFGDTSGDTLKNRSFSNNTNYA